MAVGVRSVLTLSLGLLLGGGPVLAAASDGPGSLVSATPFDNVPVHGSAWHVRYRSIAETGAKVEITGVVIVPPGMAPEGGRDVVTWGHATVGVAESCAPSTSPTFFKDVAALQHMLDHGWVVTATDFQGLGTPGPHPYLVGVSSGRAMVDAVRAARALPQAHASSHYVAWGESQGAHAALWAGQLAESYAPELDLRGIAAAAPPTDLVHGFDDISNYAVRALLTAYTSATWSQLYGISLSTFANWIGRFLIHRVAADCVRENPVGTLTRLALLMLSRQIPNNLGNPWTKPLKRNSVEPVHLPVPLLIVQGTKDEVVNQRVTRAFAARSCEAGNAVDFVSVEGGDHTTIASRSQDPTLQWIADRFAQKPPPSDCAKIDETRGGG